MEISSRVCYICKVPTDKEFYCPTTESRALKWLEAIGIDKKHIHSVTGRLKLCRKHFNSSAFTNSLQNRLNRNAVPTLFLECQQSSAAVSSKNNVQTTTATINPQVIDLPVNEEDFDPENLTKSHEFLYRLIISQLFYDGHQDLATSLSAAVQTDPPCSPSDRLLHIMIAGMEHEPNRKKRVQNHNVGASNLYAGLDLEAATESQVTAPKPTVYKMCIISHKKNNENRFSQDGQLTIDLKYKQNHVQSNDPRESIVSDIIKLDIGTKRQVPAPEPALYKTVYTTYHKENCRVGCFSQDGQLIATGSVDTSIKILDIKHLLVKSVLDEVESSRETIGYPVVRKLSDHTAEVTALEFHPKEPVLASGSRDFTIKLFNISKASNKAFKTLKDVVPIRCLTYHPVKEQLLVGTSHPLVRLYDINTGQCFISSLSSQHTGAINSIKYSLDAKYYATASKDGSIKLWDGVSNMCINTFKNPHDGAEVCSVAFTQNGKYLLSSGKDSLIKLWEFRTKRCLITYSGATVGKQEHKAQAVFNHTDDYILFPDEASTSLCVWNSRKSFREQLMFLGHNALVRMLVHSPTQAAFLTCSDDFSARLWYRRIPKI